MEAGPWDTYSLALPSCHEGSEVSSRIQGERLRVKRERSWKSNRCAPSGKCQGICNNVTWNIVPSYLNQPAAQMFWWLLRLWLCTPGRLALTSMSTAFWEWEILERGTSYIKIIFKCLRVKFKASPYQWQPAEIKTSWDTSNMAFWSMINCFWPQKLQRWFSKLLIF